MKDKKLEFCKDVPLQEHLLLSKTTIIDVIIHASQSEVSGVKRIAEVGYEPSAVPS
jgi:hypothetical protein